MARLLQDQGKLAEAEPLCREALATSRETLGKKHPSTVSFISNMAGLLESQGKLAEAEPLFREAYKYFRNLFGHRHPRTVDTAHGLGHLLKARGEHAEAAPLLAMSLEVCALPSCSRSHAVGVKLKHCSGCKSVMYCCQVSAPWLVLQSECRFVLFVCLSARGQTPQLCLRARCCCCLGPTRRSTSWSTGNRWRAATRRSAGG